MRKLKYEAPSEPGGIIESVYNQLNSQLRIDF